MLHKKEKNVTLGRNVDWLLSCPECGDIPVWVSVAKMENNWRGNADEYIGFGGTEKAIAGRYENFSEWANNEKQVGMPEICLVDSRVSFSNGRHRFAWFRDHGMTALQIQVPLDQVGIFQQQFGTYIRISQWFEVENSCA